MPDQKEKAEALQDLLKISIKRRANLRRMFTNQAKKVEPIFEHPAISEDDMELLKATQLKFQDARPELRELDKEIQNIHVILGHEDSADKDFEEADSLADHQSTFLRRIDKTRRKTQEHSGTGAGPWTGGKQLKHSSLKLPKITLPVFDGDRRTWLSFWDVA